MFPHKNFHYISHFKVGYECADLAKITEYQIRFHDPSNKSKSNDQIQTRVNRDNYFNDEYLYKRPEEMYTLNEYKYGSKPQETSKYNTEIKSCSEPYRHLRTPHKKAITDPNAANSSDRSKDKDVSHKDYKLNVKDNIRLHKDYLESPINLVRKKSEEVETEKRHVS